MPSRSSIAPPVVQPVMVQGIIGRPLPEGVRPERIVVVRLDAFGDAVIALPLLAALRRDYPRSRITFITSDIYRELFESVRSIDAVHTLPAARSRLARMAAAARLAAAIGPVDLLLDIQRSRLSGTLRMALSKRGWVAFDRLAPKSALDRYIDAARWAGLEGIEPSYDIDIDPGVRARADALLADALLNMSGNAGAARRDPSDAAPLFCLNPSGCWPTKNWPVEYYIELGRRLVDEWGGKILLIGTENVSAAGKAIARALPGDVVDLIGRTSTAEALALMRRLRLVVSDDSGLMHLAWVTGTPTIGIFGASRRIWSRPCGPRSLSFGSEDLECGACMSATCARGDLHCLRRLSVEEVFDACGRLLHDE